MGGGGGGGGRGEGFDVNKVGDARIGLVGELAAVIMLSSIRLIAEHWR